MPRIGAASPPKRRAEIALLVEWAVGALLAVILVAYMLLGNFTRYVGDDFSTTLAVRLRGFWGQSIAEYQTHDGHFFGTALQDAGGMLNPVFVRVLPGALIAAWVVLLALALRHLVPAAGRMGRLLIAAGIVYTTLRVTPNPFLAVYWMTASLAYVVPLLLAAVLVWLVSRPAGQGWRRAAIITMAGLVAFLAAGEEETYTAAQIVAMTLALAVVSRPSASWRQKRPVIAAAWLGSVAGLGVIAASPGNAIRSAAIAKLVGTRPSLLGVPSSTFSAMLDFFHTLIGTHWRDLLAMALLAAFVGARSGAISNLSVRSAMIAVALATVSTVVVVFSAIAPAALVEAQLPQVYAQIVLVHICVCGTATLGWVSGRLCRAHAERAWQAGRSMMPRYSFAAGAASMVAGVALIAGPITTLASMHHDLPAIQDYAQTKDAQAAAAIAAHNAGRTSAIVPPVANADDMGIFSHGQELSDDPSYFINRDEAEYYGIVIMALSRG